MKSKIFFTFVITLVALFLYNHYDKNKSPENILKRYLIAINTFNFEEANKYIDGKSINIRSSKELDLLKNICTDLEIKIIQKIKIDSKNIDFEVSEEYCDYKSIILFFYKNEFEKGFNGEIDLDERESRFRLYLDELKKEESLYKNKKRSIYNMQKINNSWKIII